MLGAGLLPGILIILRVLCFERVFFKALTGMVNFVIPAEAGIQESFETLDSGIPPGFRRGCPE